VLLQQPDDITHHICTFLHYRQSIRVFCISRSLRVASTRLRPLQWRVTLDEDDIVDGEVNADQLVDHMSRSTFARHIHQLDLPVSVHRGWKMGKNFIVRVSTMSTVAQCTPHLRSLKANVALRNVQADGSSEVWTLLAALTTLTLSMRCRQRYEESPTVCRCLLMASALTAGTHST
jgi:hypothetical protein